MEKMRLSIQPKEEIVRKTITAIDISVERVALNVSASIQVKMYDESGAIVDYQVIMLKGDDYAQWAADDQYIIEFVCTRLGFVLSESVQAQSTD
jgi:hypothetical protein